MFDYSNIDLALSKKFRFNTDKFNVSTEDLYSLPLEGGSINLDSIAIRLHNKIKDSSEISFVTGSKPKDVVENEIKLEIVKHVIKLKVDEKRNLKNEAEKKERINYIREAIHNKKKGDLLDMSVEDLEKELKELNK